MKHFTDLEERQQKWINEIISIRNSSVGNISYELKYLWLENLFKFLKETGLSLSEIESYLGK